MAKSTSEQAAQPNLINRFVNSPAARIVVVALIALLAFSSHVVYKHYKPGKYDAARKAADTFLTAYTNCDATTAAKYYAPFQNNATAVLAYQQQCKKGAITFTYDSISKKTSQSITYVYSAAQTGGQPVKFLVEMDTNKAGKAWTVHSVNPVQASAGQQSAGGSPQGTTTTQ